MPLLPSALPPKGEARRYAANDFLNLIAFLLRIHRDELSYAVLSDVRFYFSLHRIPVHKKGDVK